MMTNDFWMFELTPIISLIVNVIIILKTVDYIYFKCLKEE